MLGIRHTFSGLRGLELVTTATRWPRMWSLLLNDAATSLFAKRCEPHEIERATSLRLNR